MEKMRVFWELMFLQPIWSRRSPAGWPRWWNAADALADGITFDWQDRNEGFGIK